MKSAGHVFTMGMAILCFVLWTGCGSDDVDQLRSSLPFYLDSNLTPEWISPETLSSSTSHQVGEFSFTNQNGETVTHEDLDGKITVVDFFFTTCPSLCPKLTKNMGRVQDSVIDNADVLLLSYSVTPNMDSVSALKAYAEATGVVEGKWHLLTGEQRDIYHMARESFFADVDTGEAAFLHSETFYLLDKNRQLRGIYNGTLPTDIVQLIGDIRTLQGEV